MFTEFFIIFAANVAKTNIINHNFNKTMKKPTRPHWASDGMATFTNAQTVKSPNGNIAVTFSLTGNGVPTYEMTYKGKTVVKPHT